jgi:SnoaL-like domain
MGAAAELWTHLISGVPAAMGLLGEFAGVDDPIAGRVEHDGLEHFARVRHLWLVDRRARVEDVRITRAGRREVAEMIVHLVEGGRTFDVPSADRSFSLPVVTVAEEGPGAAKWLRLYFSRWPIYGAHHVRPRVAAPDPNALLSDVMAEYHRALAAGDLDRILGCFEESAYAREPSGGAYRYEGREKLREFYRAVFSSGGGLDLEHCTVTDDGEACVLEYNVVRWGRHSLTPQAGIGVYERGRSGRLTAARIYDDVDPPRPD